MLDDEGALLGGFTFGVEFGLIYVRDAEGQGLTQAPDWDPGTDAVLAAPSALLVAVRHYSDGPVHCQVWNSGDRTGRLPRVLHTGSLDVASGFLLIGDVNEDVLLRIRPDSDAVGITVRADSARYASHIDIELSGV